MRWVYRNIAFISLGKFWKGVYIHFVPGFVMRLFWSQGKLGFDCRRLGPLPRGF